MERAVYRQTNFGEEEIIDQAYDISREPSLRAREIVQALRVKPYDDYSRWGIRDGLQYPYEASFAEVLPRGNLSQLVELSRQEIRKGLVLDFMGYGQVLRELPLTGGLAVALTDPRSKKNKESDTQRNISFVEGNVLRSSTWNEIKNWLAKQETDDQRFDLILSRPVRGLDALTNHHKVSIIILQRLWQLLSSQNGVLLTQFRKEVFDLNLVNRWVMLLNRTKGIKASLSLTRDPPCYPGAFKPAISLIKSEGAPEKLPLLSELSYCLQY